MEEVTLRDLLDVFNARMSDQNERLTRHEEQMKTLATNQERLVEATNHKIDEVQKRFLRVLGLILLIGAPLIYNQWDEIIRNASRFF